MRFHKTAPRHTTNKPLNSKSGSFLIFYLTPSMKAKI
jgi:hypothetical protein